MPPGSVVLRLARSWTPIKEANVSPARTKMGEMRIVLGSGEVERAGGTGSRPFEKVEVDHGGFHRGNVSNSGFSTNTPGAG
jgi:hypothetical protein